MVNLAVFDYSGNNPVRYTDPTGRDVGNPGRDEPPERKLYSWPAASGRVTSGYGPRNDAAPTLHLALDIAPMVPGEKGGAVLAMEEGVVIRAGVNEHGLSVIEIKHPDGGRRERRGAGIAAAIGLAGLALPILLGAFGADYFDGRNLIPVFVPLIVVLAAGFAVRRAGWAGLALAGAFCLCSLIFTIEINACPGFGGGTCETLRRK